MSVHACAPDPAALLAHFNKAIDENDIWKHDGDGGFTLSSPQWQGKASWNVSVQPDGLHFGLVFRDVMSAKTVTNGIYHRELRKMLLERFDTELSNLTSFDDICGRAPGLLVSQPRGVMCQSRTAAQQ